MRAPILLLAAVSGVACSDAELTEVVATPPGETLEYRAFALDGANGGEVALELEGTVDELVALLLDFEHAAGRRAWAREFETLETEGARVRARWSFDGKLGVNPTIELELVTTRAEGAAQIAFEVVDPGLGLAVFDGEYRIEPLASDPPRVRFTQRITIDSGLPLVNATPDDVEAGLREDARRIAAWLAERRAAGSGGSAPR